MFKLLAYFYRLDWIELSLGAGMYASWMLRVSFLAFVFLPRFSFFMFAPLVLFTSLIVHSSCIFVLRVRCFSLHIINWASLVIFASVLRCDSQSFGPVYSFIRLVSLLVLVFHLILLLSCKYFACFICFFFQFSVLLSLSFVVILFSLCIYLIFVLQYRFSLFQIACHRFVSVVERLDSAKAASLLPFFYLLPILPGFCITISICDSLLQTKLLWYLLLSGLLHVLEGILRLKDCYPVFPRFSKKL